MTPPAGPGLPVLAAAPAAEVRESHTSWVLLAGDRAYKVKKPVRFAFLDQRTPARRRALCRAELRLNRPLAPDLYLAVRGLVPAGEDGRLRLASEDDPAAVDHAVEMRRFDERETLAALVRAGALRDDQLDAVAARVAAFHAGARHVAAPSHPPAALAAALARIDRNGEELLALLDDRAERALVVAHLRCAAAFATARADELAARAAHGCVRELHGDLRAEHVLPGPPVRIVDRLEFSRVLREVDTADELGFLAMDLTALGDPAAARRVVAAYRAAGGDPGDDDLIAWHALHRALVRAKVALLRTPPDPGAARARLDVAERFAWQLRLPPVLAVCGPAASGKSSLAEELGRRCGRTVLAADVVRKQLAGLPPTHRGREEDYAPGVNLRTYAELGRRAAALAGAGEGVVVDATFRHRADRDAFHAALAESMPVAVAGPAAGALPFHKPVFAECTVPAAVLAERATRRLADPGRISDATPALALHQLGAWEPLHEVSAERHRLLRADREPAALAATLAAALDGALAA